MDRLLYGNYMVPSAELRPYVQITNMPQLSKASYAANNLRFRDVRPVREATCSLTGVQQARLASQIGCRASNNTAAFLQVPLGFITISWAPPPCQHVSAYTDVLSAWTGHSCKHGGPAGWATLVLELADGQSSYCSALPCSTFRCMLLPGLACSLHSLAACSLRQRSDALEGCSWLAMGGAIAAADGNTDKFCEDVVYPF